jgi:hypothetical protein
MALLKAVLLAYASYELLDIYRIALFLTALYTA